MTFLIYTLSWVVGIVLSIVILFVWSIIADERRWKAEKKQWGS